MTYLIALALGIALLVAPPSWSASSLGDKWIDYCGTFEAVGKKDPVKWKECVREWVRLKEAENLQLAEERRKAAQAQPGYREGSATLCKAQDGSVVKIDPGSTWRWKDLQSYIKSEIGAAHVLEVKTLEGRGSCVQFVRVTYWEVK